MQQNDLSAWSSEQVALQRWLAAPKVARKPKTIELLADSLGVDRATLYRWRKLAGFTDEVRKLIKENLDDDLPDIYQALRKEAKAGSFQHIKLVLELSGEYVEQKKIDMTQTLNADQFAALSQEAKTKAALITTIAATAWNPEQEPDAD